MADDAEKETHTEEQKANEEKAEPKQEEMKEQFLRLMAEFDNYKKRVRNEIAGARDMGRADVISHMLPVVDEFELAIAAISKSEDKIALKGIEMLYSNFISALKKEGLSEIEVDGKFDPYKHEIMLVRESDKKEGTIIEVVKKGYNLNNVMIRPASVIVAKGKETEKKEEKKETDKKEE